MPDAIPVTSKSYVSIDLETTGLDRQKSQILEFGAVIETDSWSEPLENLFKFRAYVKHPVYSGDPYALALNHKILEKLANPKKYPGDTFLDVGDLLLVFGRWLKANGVDPLHIVGAGKNFSSFDRQMIYALNPEASGINFKHRSIEPAMLYWQPDIDGSVLPSTHDCCVRAGITPGGKHETIEDALEVIQMVRNSRRLKEYVR